MRSRCQVKPTRRRGRERPGKVSKQAVSQFRSSPVSSRSTYTSMECIHLLIAKSMACSAQRKLFGECGPGFSDDTVRDSCESCGRGAVAAIESLLSDVLQLLATFALDRREVSSRAVCDLWQVRRFSTCCASSLASLTRSCNASQAVEVATPRDTVAALSLLSSAEVNIIVDAYAIAA